MIVIFSCIIGGFGLGQAGPNFQYLAAGRVAGRRLFEARLITLDALVACTCASVAALPARIALGSLPSRQCIVPTNATQPRAPVGVRRTCYLRKPKLKTSRRLHGSCAVRLR